MTAGDVQVAQIAAAEGNGPDGGAIAESVGQAERAQVRETADGLRQDLGGELMCSGEVQTPQALVTGYKASLFTPDWQFSEGTSNLMLFPNKTNILATV